MGIIYSKMLQNNFQCIVIQMFFIYHKVKLFSEIYKLTESLDCVAIDYPATNVQ